MSAYRLFIYDHCPYCVKARMIFGLKNQTLENVTLLNDDEKTPVSMIGQKMVPILEKENGKFMPESLDIIKYIDSKHSPEQVVWEEDSALMETLHQARVDYYSLVMPRWVRSNMEEFKTESARNYFQNKKEQMIGSFSSALEQTETFKKNISPILESLDQQLPSSGEWYKGDQISLNDFHLFAFLRGLTIVKNLSFPKVLQKYAERTAQKTNVPLSTDIAC
ncbi:MAG: glutaredoxin 2 [Bdellovibrionales bacterium]|nr:glutaredoxin 2 [Bdellovibrionales bacterium]